MGHLDRSHAWRGRSVAWARLGSGPPVVLLHGTPWSSALWLPIARALATDRTVYLYDMPGYGDSSRDPEHPVDLACQGELLADLLQTWGLTHPDVIAHDIGGAVALRARLLLGARYQSLCLLDAVVLRPWGSPFFRLVQQNAAVFTQLPAAMHRGALEAYIAGASHRGLRPDDLAMLVRPWLGASGQQAFYRQIAQADERYTDEVEPLLGQVTEPVHLIWGEQDTWIPADRAERLRSAIPHASVRLIADAGHLIHLDAPTELTAELVRWLQHPVSRAQDRSQS